MHRLMLGVLGAATMAFAVPAAAQDFPVMGGDYWTVSEITIDDGHFAEEIAGLRQHPMPRDASGGRLLQRELAVAGGIERGGRLVVREVQPAFAALGIDADAHVAGAGIAQLFLGGAAGMEGGGDPGRIRRHVAEIDEAAVAGIVFAFKIAGAAAEAGWPLDRVKAVTQKAIDSCRTVGVALSPCTIPTRGKPGFELDDDTIEMGMGIHGEQGVWRGPLKNADALVDEMLKRLLDEGIFAGKKVAVLCNSLGATPLGTRLIGAPRMSTTGLPSSAWPIRIEAADASSSPSPIWVACSS